MKKLLLALVLFAAPAQAAPSDHAAQLLRWLNALDLVPTTQQLADAGVTADGQALYAVAADPSLPRYPRARATAFLARYPGAQTQARLERLLAESPDLEVRVQALTALGYLEGAAALPRLTGLLASGEPELRAAAVRGLLRLGSPAAKARLLAHRAVESEAYVRALLPQP